jgi:hypothetical protein
MPRLSVSDIIKGSGLILLLLASSLVGLGIRSQVAAQGPEVSRITFQELGYNEHVLRGPMASTHYYFGLPGTWEPLEGSFLTLYLEHTISGPAEYALTRLEVKLNHEVLYTEDIEILGDQQVQVVIAPTALLSLENRYINDLEVSLEVGASCERAQRSALAVHASSSLYFVYQERLLPVDLAIYPKPLYQRSFDPDSVWLVLPPEPDSADVEAAAIVASRLGKLTQGNIVVSTTIASDIWTVGAWDEHLILVGQPESNPLLTNIALPVPLAERRMILWSEMPTSVEPGKAFSYMVSVTNTEQYSQVMTVKDRLPGGATWMSCSGECEEDEPGLLRWETGQVAPGQGASTIVRLHTDGRVPPGTAMQHTATLLDQWGNAVNVDTLTTTVALTNSQQTVRTTDTKGRYFFVHDGRGVAESDGLIQELVSPWNAHRAVVVVTGLSQQALLRAAAALGSETRFPGMSGPFALVQMIHPASNDAPSLLEDMSFASMGHTDTTLRGLYSNATDYTFDLPWGWSLTDEGYVALHFAHGVSDLDNSPTLEIRLNGHSFHSISLSEEQSDATWATIPLPVSVLKAGLNTLTVRCSYDIGWCEDVRNDRAWVTLFADSFFHLPYEREKLALDLDMFPYPFNRQPGLEDVVFLLSSQPSLAEVEGTIRIAAKLGREAKGDDFTPRVALGGNPDTDRWLGYNMIMVGQPTSNPYIAVVNDTLPQPFLPGTNELRQTVDPVVYRPEPEVDLGLVQELFSPWDKSQAMLVVTGNTPAGVEWAIQALTDDQLTWRLEGNLALVRDGGVWTTDTRQPISEEVGILPVEGEPAPTPEATTTPTPTPCPTPTANPTLVPTSTIAPAAPVLAKSTRPAWLLPLLILSILIVVGTMAVAIWRART